MRKIFNITALVLLSALIGTGVLAGDNARKHIKKAQKLRNSNKFEASESEYLLALKEDPNSFDAQFELGLLYEAAFYDPTRALESFEKAEKIMNDTVFELYYHLGRAYHYFEEYDKAIQAYSIYNRGIMGNGDGAIVTSHSLRQINQAEFAKTYDQHLMDGMMENLGEKVNTYNSEYIPVLIHGDSSLLFTRRGDENLGDFYWDNQYYEDMYASGYVNGELTQAKSIKSVKGAFDNLNNTKKHESVVETSPSGDTLILFAKNKLWFTTLKDGKWQEPTKFSKEINISGYQRHGAFTPDGKTLYFSSDYNQGKGGYDIYVSTLQNGEWSEAKNLGDVINTNGHEDSPFITADGKTMYFSSTGHEGMGGYDVFMSEWIDGNWSKPVNMGTPVNTPADDIYLMIESEDQIYIASNRKGGFGKMDIYQFAPYGIPDYNNCDEMVNEPIVIPSEGVHIEAFGKDTVFINTMEVYDAKASSAGKDSITHYFWKYNEDEFEQYAYEMVFNDLGTEKLILEVIARSPSGFETHYCLTKEITVIQEPIDEDTLVAFFNLKNIYFDFDKYNIRKDARDTMEYNINQLKDHPDVMIEVHGHTDAFGTNTYNQKLGERRAQSAVDYLIKKGINKDRIITIISKGEEHPAVPNANPDGSDNPVNRQKNRRVEFKPVRKTDVVSKL